MNTNTGVVYELGEPVATYIGMAPMAGFAVSFAEAEARAGRRLSVDERDAVAAVRAGDPVVPVSGEVAQMAKLGARELERRRRRAKAARQSRKRNR